MKNLIIILSLFFTIGSFAQAEKKSSEKTKSALKSVQFTPNTPEESGLKNITDLEKFIPLNQETRAMLLELFTTKYRMFNEVGDMSFERKAIISESIESKLQSSIDEVTFKKIKANKALFATLIN